MSLLSSLFGSSVPALSAGELNEKLKVGKRPILIDFHKPEEDIARREKTYSCHNFVVPFPAGCCFHHVGLVTISFVPKIQARS
jgi:hypothetical protein